MVGKSKNKTVIPSSKVREIATAAVSTHKGDKLPNPACRMDLTELTSQTCTKPAVSITDTDGSDQSNNRLTELERRVEEMSISLGVNVGGAHGAGGEQGGVLGLAVGERIDRLEDGE